MSKTSGATITDATRRPQFEGRQLAHGHPQPREISFTARPPSRLAATYSESRHFTT
jgi:hypothetical protein